MVATSRSLRNGPSAYDTSVERLSYYRIRGSRLAACGGSRDEKVRRFAAATLRARDRKQLAVVMRDRLIHRELARGHRDRGRGAHRGEARRSSALISLRCRNSVPASASRGISAMLLQSFRSGMVREPFTTTVGVRYLRSFHPADSDVHGTHAQLLRVNLRRLVPQIQPDRFTQCLVQLVQRSA